MLKADVVWSKIKSTTMHVESLLIPRLDGGKSFNLNQSYNLGPQDLSLATLMFNSCLCVVLFYKLAGGGGAVGVGGYNNVHTLEWTVAHAAREVNIFHIGNLCISFHSGDGC